MYLNIVKLECDSLNTNITTGETSRATTSFHFFTSLTIFTFFFNIFTSLTPHSSWDSNHPMHHRHLCGRRFLLCCSSLLGLAAGSSWSKMLDLRRSRSSCPSRLSRPHPWSWHNGTDRWWYHRKFELQNRWSSTSIPSQPPLVLSVSSHGWWGICRDSLVSLLHLWMGERWVIANSLHRILVIIVI